MVAEQMEDTFFGLSQSVPGIGLVLMGKADIALAAVLTVSLAK